MSDHDIQIDVLFSGGISPVKVKGRYRLALVLVAMGMVVLPMLYVGLILFAGFGIYHYSIQATAIFADSFSFLVLIAYLTPIVAGCIGLFFVVKPLFARPAKKDPPFEVAPEEAPLLFEFVDRICAVVIAPKPSRIVVDCDANASASLAKGIGLLPGSELTLTIGLPLVSALSVQELGGVLAHELGHFAQGAGMRLSYIIRSISHWFARVVHERDEWDERLEAWTTRSDLRIRLMLIVAQFFVAVSRKILWGLMMAGNVISGLMLRQMEYDADRYEARVVGRLAFEETFTKLNLIGLSTRAAYGALSATWAEKKLADNFPKLVQEQFARLTPALRNSLAASLRTGKAGWLDTHPSHQDRVRNVEHESAVGILSGEMSAECLFTNYDDVAKSTTLLLYRDIIGVELQPSNLVDAAQLISERHQIEQDNDASLRFFGTSLLLDRKVFIDIDNVPRADEGLAELTANLVEARASISSEVSNYEDLASARSEVWRGSVVTRSGLTLIRCGIAFEPTDFELQSLNLANARDAYVARSKELADWELSHSAAVDHARARLSSVCKILQIPGIVQQYPDLEEAAEELASFVPLVQTLAPLASKARALGDSHTVAGVLISRLADGGEVSSESESQVLKLSHEMRKSIKEIRSALAYVPYPFDHADGKVSIGTALLLKVPTSADSAVMEVFEAADSVASRYFQLWYRVVGRIAAMGELVERVLGMPPIKVEATDS